MTTSVAMCTYNGARFVEEQLRSILDQTIPIGEIVICDDGSTDETIAIIEKVAKETTIPVYIHINERNLGCVANFEKAIRLCQGDIIFLSDQDDVWMPNKVEVITKWFDQHPAMNVVFGDAILIDENSEIIFNSVISQSFNQHNEEGTPIRLWECVGFSKLSQRQFDEGLGFELWIRLNRATGATMAFKRTLLKTIQLKYSNKYLYHDFILSFHALLNNMLGYIVQPIMYYRQHSSQAIGCLYMYQYAKDYEDARICSKCWTDFSYISLNKSFTNRLLFYKKRCRFKYSFLASAVVLNWCHYIKLYKSLWKQMFYFDYMESMQHNVKRVKKAMRIIFSTK